MEIFVQPIAFRLGGVPVTHATLVSAATSIVLVAVALVLRRAFFRRPDGLCATAAEIAVDSLDNLVTEIVGRRSTALLVLSGTLFAHIAACNLAGQIPRVPPPMSSLAATSALALFVFAAVPVAGLVSRGPGAYLRSCFGGNPLMLPLHWMSDVTRIFALSVRLFGNIMSGHFLVALLVALAGFLVPTPIMALEVFIGLMQAYIFAVLATVYIGASIRAGEE